MNARTTRWSLRGGALLGIVLAASAATEVPAERQYAVFILETKAGTQTVRNTPAGREVFFEFSDRGRGANITAKFEVDARGNPVRYAGSGNDYLRSKIDETFGLEDGTAHWKSTKETGSTATGGKPFFFLPADGPPEMMAALARALLASPSHRVDLLPGGVAEIQQGETVELKTASGKRPVTLYTISGLDLEPTRVWLDPQQQLFASIGGWFTTVVAGEEATLPRLREIQNAAASARREAMAQKLAHSPGQAGLLIRNARLFDSVSGVVRPNFSVLIVGNRIAAVGPDEQILVPAGVEVTDARGQFLMPGLWDNHAHLEASDCLLHIANGITTVRDLGNNYDVLVPLVARMDAGKEIGPRVFIAAVIDAHGPLAGPTKLFVDNEQDARRVVGWVADQGFAQLKIYSSISPKLVPLLAELAHARGLRVSGHVPSGMTAEEFVRAGADEIQHINFIFLNFLADKTRDTRGMARFTLLAEGAASIDPAGEKERAFIGLLRERHTVIDPTVGIFEGMFTAKPNAVAPGLQAVADRFPPQLRRGLLGGGLQIPPEKAALFAATPPALLRFVKAMHDAGVPIVPGTDGFAGFMLHRELELYVRAGIPANEVLQMATIGAARVMGAERDLGRIAPGALADMIFIDGDPTTNISDVRRVRTVIKDGRVYESAKLLEAVGVRGVEPQP